MSRVIYNSENRITQHYKPGIHHGVDLGYNGKDENKNIIYANCKGIVYEIVDGLDNIKNPTGVKKWGNYVYIKHPNGMYTRYAHLKKKTIKVKKGQTVDEKTILGIMGDSGHATARHLHFEVSKGYSSSKRINPERYLLDPVYKSEKTTYKGTFPYVPTNSSLKRGMKNVEVGYLQKFLNWVNGCNLSIDNSFGPATEKQVKIFQKNYGLVVDGHFGNKSLAKAKTIIK